MQEKEEKNSQLKLRARDKEANLAVKIPPKRTLKTGIVSRTMNKASKSRYAGEGTLGVAAGL